MLLPPGSARAVVRGRFTQPMLRAARLGPCFLDGRALWTQADGVAPAGRTTDRPSAHRHLRRSSMTAPSPSILVHQLAQTRRLPRCVRHLVVVEVDVNVLSCRSGAGELLTTRQCFGVERSPPAVVVPARDTGRPTSSPVRSRSPSCHRPRAREASVRKGRRGRKGGRTTCRGQRPCSTLHRRRPHGEPSVDRSASYRRPPPSEETA